MSDFRFAEIGWLNAAWVVLLIAGLLVALEFRGRTLLDRFASPLMQVRLVRKTTLTRRLTGIVLFVLCLLSLVLALMRPQWGMTVQQLTRVDSQIMICLDVSKSMLAEDVVPNRLERAKAEIDSLLGLMDEGQQVGLTAFAGKASVMCPMTTDFGFLRLILQEVEPSSVGLGGTRIGEAIQKAVSGFRETGDVQRLILLITDGEDHDSFPLDAAEEAKTRGVRIVSIGFGDEAGSKIEITDANTGVRSFVKDRNGIDVISRLDGETLRDIALKTEGAYIPAGTGALDLQSIYETHIRTLLKGGETQEQRVIRNEAYQWCVLAALLLFVGSLMTPVVFAKNLRSDEAGWATTVRSAQVGVLAIALVGVFDNRLTAQNPPDTKGAEPSAAPATGAPTGTLPSGDEPLQASDSDPAVSSDDGNSAAEAEFAPRETYNMAVQYISSDPDRAERMLTKARQNAGVDGELRYRTLYNLGWVEVNRAEQLTESEPEQALQRLELAASRFREAIRVRPASNEARHNLEIISRRILVLRDALAKRNPQDVAQRLDSLIESQRAHQAMLQDQTSRLDSIDPNDSDLRSQFRRLGVEQRQILSDMQKLADDGRQEVEALKQEADNQDDQANGESQMRAAQLSSMLGYLDESIQRMSKARSFTRRMQSERAFIRWAAALSASKRARDQLRNPVEVLGVLIGDASEMARLTSELAEGQEPAINTAPLTTPPWLTTDYLSEAQTEMTERTNELREILAAGLSGQPEETDADLADLLASIRDALPFLETAVSAFEQAQEELDRSNVRGGFEKQSEALVALMDAAEFFFDLRRLIEAMYRDELIVQAMFGQVDLPEGAALGSGAIELQAKNLDRAARLAGMLDTELEKLAQASQAADDSLGAANPAASSAPMPQQPEPSPEQLQAQQQRIEIAKQILSAAESSMRDVTQLLRDRLSTENAPASVSRPDDEAPAEPDSPDDETPSKPQDQDNEPPPESAAPGEPTPVEPPVTAAAPISDTNSQTMDDSNGSIPTTSVDQAVERIEDLRRLFFSVVEHLRDTAQRQAELNDNVVQQAAGMGVGNTGSLQSRQTELSSISTEIASALEEQAVQAETAETNSVPGAASTQQVSPEDATVLKKAADLVSEGSQAMESAATSLQALAQTEVDTAADVDEGLDEDGVASSSVSGSAENATLESIDSTAESPDGSASEGDEQSADSQYQPTIEHQRIALEKLAQALALLDDQQSGRIQNQQPDQQKQQQGQQDQQDQQDQSQQAKQNMNAGQMLQAIRDREAQRRREKNSNQVAPEGAVEKDW